MLSTILIALAALVAVLVVVIAMQPGSFRIERSATIAAPPSAVFPLVNDFHNWTAWSPWEKLDPAMVRTYSGAPAGAGAVYQWTGNKNVGEGRMTIVESRPNELLRMRLEFLKPFKATNEAIFSFAPVSNQTKVTWAMTGDKNFIFKAVHMVMNMDKMCGRMFEQGLASLNDAAKSSAANANAALQHA